MIFPKSSTSARVWPNTTRPPWSRLQALGDRLQENSPSAAKHYEETSEVNRSPMPDSNIRYSRTQTSDWPTAIITIARGIAPGKLFTVCGPAGQPIGSKPSPRPRGKHGHLGVSELSDLDRRTQGARRCLTGGHQALCHADNGDLLWLLIRKNRKSQIKHHISRLPRVENVIIFLTIEREMF
jgi:hypothetical protein